MILGMSIGAFTILHVIITLVAIGSGLIVVGGMFASHRLPVTTALFLFTTALTSVTGFLFPIHGFTPALGVGIVACMVLAVALFALYKEHLVGAWRWIYVIAAVASRYALRVGEIDVLVVSDGVLSLPGAMLAHNADPAVRAAWLKDMFLPPDVLEWALNVVVVRSGGRTILIDAGLGADPNLNLPRAGRLAPRLEAAGIDLASVTDVVLTHLHMDHVGGLLVDGVRDRLRPDLRVHLAAA